MHIIYDENGTPMPHGTGSDAHRHPGTDEKGCGGNGHCGACGEEQCADETLSALAHLIRHNEQLTAAIDRLAAQTDEKGMPDAAAQIRRSAADFQKGNMYLNLAFSLYKQHLLEKGISAE